MAKFVSTLEYDKIPLEVVSHVKKSILDSFGNMMGGLNSLEATTVRNAVLEYDKTTDATIIGTGRKVSVPHAALVNAVANEGSDFSACGADICMQTATVPAALAVAEKEGLDGKRFLAAVIAGYELVFRVGMAIDNSTMRALGFYPTGHCGPFGSAAATGKLLNLNVDQMTMAFGLAGSQALGIHAYAAEGMRTKAIFCGKAAENGLTSCYMAKQGLPGPAWVMEAEDGGFMKCFSDQKFNLAETTHSLGEEFYSAYLDFKLFPCCHYTHAYIAATLDLVQKEKLNPQDIKKIIAYVTKVQTTTIAMPERYEPQSVMAAQFSLPYVVARAIKDRKVDLSTFTEEKIKDKETLELAKKMDFVRDPELEKKFGKYEGKDFTMPAKLTIITKKGKELTAQSIEPHPTSELLEEKFSSQARGILPDSKVSKIISIIEKLEELKDINDLIELTRN
ncbi:hypothetical protein A2W24_03785 [Microgenomates group bacterium RBG_16_45_19]|nr:MAG: hypothetical protein A2W24_03785 [Microgenomates group bacterium RBG_16_45_19]